MKNKKALFFSVCVLVTSFCGVYVALRYFKTPLPKYYPTLHLWSAAKQGAAPAMGWYALFGAALAAALFLGGASYAVLSRVIRDGRQCAGLVRPFTWLAAATVLYMVIFNVHHEYISWFLKKH